MAALVQAEAATISRALCSFLSLTPLQLFPRPDGPAPYPNLLPLKPYLLTSGHFSGKKISLRTSPSLSLSELLYQSVRARMVRQLTYVGGADSQLRVSLQATPNQPPRARAGPPHGGS